MIALAVLSKWHMHSINVKTAFLYRELDKELYMEQPEGFKVKGQEHKVFHLRKALYGLKQAALQWWRALDKSIRKLGFRHLKSDSGIFVLSRRNGLQVIAIVYVNDTIFMEPDLHQVDMMKALFIDIWECQDLEETKEFLHMNIHYQRDTIILEQKDYLHKVIECFGMHNTKSTPTPLPLGYNLSPNLHTVNEQLKMHYQQLIGSLLYHILGTHPDITFAVTKMSQYAANPSKKHYDKALYIYCYLVGMVIVDVLSSSSPWLSIW
jgi:hypothetical protein